MMKRIPKTIRVMLGMGTGVMTAVMLMKLFPSLTPVSDMLAIVNCAFFVTMLTLCDEEEPHIAVAFLFWLVTMSLVICPVMMRFSTAGVLKGFAYAGVLLAGAYVLMRLMLLIKGVEYDSAEATLYRIFIYDDLYYRFFGGSLLRILMDQNDDDGGEEE